MSNGLAKPRILVVSERQSVHDWFRSFAASLAGWNSLYSDMAETAIAFEDGLRLDELSFEFALAPIDSLRMVRQAGQSRQSYTLAIVDFQPPYREGVEQIHRLWQADEALFVLGAVDSADGMWSLIASQLERRDCFAFVHSPLDAVEVGQVLSMQLDRFRLQEELLARDRQLRSAQAAQESARAALRDMQIYRTELAANISHEFRTPLNAILGFAALLGKEPLQAGQLAKVRQIHEAGEALHQLIENFLTFSKLTQGEIRLSKSAFGPADLIADTVEAVRPAAMEKGLALRFHIAATVPPRLCGDGYRIRQILEQLLENAIKFTLGGAVHVQVTVDEETESTVLLRAAVSDTGVGIPADRQAALFNAFSQADGSATRQFGGLGLGLSLCKQMLDLMGGQIGFRSTPGEGSSFWITVPLEKGVSALEQNGKPGPASFDSSETLGGADSGNLPKSRPESAAKRRVLVVEHEWLARTSMEMLLVRMGCFVDLAESLAEATSTVRSWPYDLILLDAHLPEAEFPEAMAILRENRFPSDTPLRIVCLTASDDPAERAACLSAGADGALPREFDPEQFCEIVAQQLGTAGSQQEETPSDFSGRQLPGEFQDYLRGLRDCLESQDFDELERRARHFRELSERAGEKQIADEALRVQLAARRRDLLAAAAVVNRLDEPLQELLSRTCSTTAPCACSE